MDFERYSDDEFCDVAEGILEDIILEAGKRLYDLSTSSDEDNASIRSRLNKITQQLSGIQYMNQANNMKRHIRDISSGKTSLSQLRESSAFGASTSDVILVNTFVNRIKDAVVLSVDRRDVTTCLSTVLNPRSSN
ncbi:hypothetical protein WA588_006266, partial [Blastocystis sp. NMH]